MNRKLIAFPLSFLLLILSLTNCSKKCDGPNQNGEGIIREIPDIQLAATREVVYRSEKDLCSVYADSVLLYPRRKEFNFAKQSVLSHLVSGYCNMKILRNIRRDKTAKTVTYELTKYQCGSCKELKMDYNMVVVEKIPADWKVIFQLIDK